MENTITFNVKEFKEYLYTVIESSYEMGMAYVKTPPYFSKEEAIKRFQDMSWDIIKNVWNINE